MALSEDAVTRLRSLLASSASSFDARFRVEREVGAGGMGRVFAAHERAGGQPIAIKVLELNSEDDVARFAVEAEVLEQLAHPAIVSYIAHGVTPEGRPYLAMQWLDGETLQARLVRGALAIREAVAIGERVAGALAYLHGRGVVHRDIKPSNVFLVGGDPRAAVVIDLGVAKQLGARDALTRTGQLVGTPGYMAPEQAMGHANIDGRVDLFALGCLLYEAIAGQPPFPGAAVVEVLARLLMQDPAPLERLREDVPERLATLIAVLLAKRAEDRGLSTGDAAAELAAIARALDGGDAAALRKSRYARPPAASASASTIDARPRRHKRRVWLVIGAVVLAVAAGAAALAVRKRDAPVAIAASIKLPPRIERARVPGPLVAGTIVDAPTPDQFGSRVLTAAWCAPRGAVLAALEDGRLMAIARSGSVEKLAALELAERDIPATAFEPSSIVCLASGRVLAVVRGRGFVLDAAPGGGVTVRRVDGDAARFVTGVRYQQTARWAGAGAIWEWDGEAVRKVRAACESPRALSPSGERLLCVRNGRFVVDGVLATTEKGGRATTATSIDGPPGITASWSGDSETVYVQAAHAVTRWHVLEPLADELVARSAGPAVEVGFWLAGTMPGQLTRTAIHDDSVKQLPPLALSARGAEILAAIPEHQEVVIGYGRRGSHGLQTVRVSDTEAPALPALRHHAAVVALAFDARGSALASLGYDGELIVRPLDPTGPQRREFARTDVPRAPRLAWPASGPLAMVGMQTVVVWDDAGKTREFADTEPAGDPQGYSATAALLDTGQLVRANKRGIRIIRPDGGEGDWVSRIEVAVRDLELSRRHALLKFGNGTSARVVDLETQLRVIDLVDTPFAAVTFVDGDEPVLIAADTRGQVFAVTRRDARPLAALGAPVIAAIAAPAGRRVAVAAGREVVVFDADRAVEVMRGELAMPITAIAWDASGRRLAAAGRDTEIRVFDVP